jgi:hypothetical protein
LEYCSKYQLMLQFISDLPPHVVGIHASGDVTQYEYEVTLIPLLDELLKKNKRINFILILETDIKDFTPGAWCGNVKIGLKYFFKWNKVVVVSDQKGVHGISDLFRYIIPGKYKSFPLDQIDKALRWVAEK